MNRERKLSVMAGRASKVVALKKTVQLDSIQGQISFVGSISGEAVS